MSPSRCSKIEPRTLIPFFSGNSKVKSYQVHACQWLRKRLRSVSLLEVMFVIQYGRFCPLLLNYVNRRDYENLWIHELNEARFRGKNLLIQFSVFSCSSFFVEILNKYMIIGIYSPPNLHGWSKINDITTKCAYKYDFFCHSILLQII